MALFVLLLFLSLFPPPAHSPPPSTGPPHSHPPRTPLWDRPPQASKSTHCSLVPPLYSLPSTPPSTSSKRVRLFCAVVGFVGTFAGLCSVVYYVWSAIRGSRAIKRQSTKAIKRQRSQPVKFSLAELAVASNHFAREDRLGHGVFAVVYRGQLADGSVVAIKRAVDVTGSDSKNLRKMLSENKKKIQASSFKMELRVLPHLYHKNLVRLVGHCKEEKENLLVYEYMENGALNDHLHGRHSLNSAVHSLKARVKIAVDIARGLDYLHHFACPPIIHRDIKSSNILLDVDWSAKVADFGGALIGNPPIDTSLQSLILGTVGYMDVDSIKDGVTTPMRDVYAFGVVLLELLTGKKAVLDNDDHLIDLIVPKIQANRLDDIIDQRIKPGQVNEVYAIQLVAITANCCLQWKARKRPIMSDIVLNLEKALALLCDERDDGNESLSTDSATALIAHLQRRVKDGTVASGSLNDESLSYF